MGLRSKFTINQDIFYSTYYEDLMGHGLISKVWGRIHKEMELMFRNQIFSKVLEVGAGNGEHFQFLEGVVSRYYATDIRIDGLKRNLNNIKNVIIQKEDVSNLSFKDSYFERTIVTCLLVHLDKPEVAIREIHRVTKPGGFVSIYVPCEPGFFLRFCRRFSTRRKARRLGVANIEFIHYQEHRTYFLAVDFFIKSQFQSGMIKSKFYPFAFLPWSFNLFKIYQIQKEQ
jgi:ubiquinone/menaquinone biosynthesis C-methylase UbiE